MDCGGEDKTVVSTAGGLVWYDDDGAAAGKVEGSGWKLTVSGLKGGHSGSNIDKGAGQCEQNCGPLPLRSWSKPSWRSGSRIGTVG